MFTSYWIIDTSLVVLTVLYLLHKYTSRKYDYWKKRNIFYLKPLPFFGNFLDISLFRITIGEYFKKLYNQTQQPYFGIFVFDEPYLVIRSPELIKSILIRDFNYFTDRSILASKHDNISAEMMFLAKSPQWKVTRTKITPVFTSGKLKTMIPHINRVGVAAVKYLAKLKSKHNESIEAKEVCAKYTTDVIAKCAFAINAHSFDNEDATFRKIGRLAFDFRWATAIQQTSYFFLPTFANLFRMNFVDRRVMNFLSTTLGSAIQQREVLNGVQGNDLIDTIIEIKKNKEFCKENNFEGDRLLAQPIQFYLAGFETSSTTMAFTLYELCINPKIQDSLRCEIKSVLQQHDENVTYEAIKDMKYLHMCVCETLRKYPVLPFLDRICNMDYTIPGTNTVIEKGIRVFIPMFGIHYDADYFSDPNQYKPERFLAQNVKKIPSCAYIPFGEGPRNCIGERFGLLTTKIGLIHILSEYKVEKSPDTPVPLVFEPKSFILSSNVGLPMKFTRL